MVGTWAIWALGFVSIIPARKKHFHGLHCFKLTCPTSMNPVVDLQAAASADELQNSRPWWLEGRTSTDINFQKNHWLPSLFNDFYRCSWILIHLDWFSYVFHWQHVHWLVVIVHHFCIGSNQFVIDVNGFPLMFIDVLLISTHLLWISIVWSLTFHHCYRCSTIFIYFYTLS